ncbi:hypothetical protein NGM37_42635 [Streptomyces sp. TRM76130]|nr:hypothetical protein [Streptomyces sp. TRM76130]
MAARQAHQDHRSACTTCTDQARCLEGDRLWTAFTRVQDAYLKRQRGTH